MKEMKTEFIDFSLASEAGKALNKLRNQKLSPKRRSEIAKIASMSTRKYVEKREKERRENLITNL